MDLEDWIERGKATERMTNLATNFLLQNYDLISNFIDSDMVLGRVEACASLWPAIN